MMVVTRKANVMYQYPKKDRRHLVHKLPPISPHHTVVMLGTVVVVVVVVMGISGNNSSSSNYSGSSGSGSGSEK